MSIEHLLNERCSIYVGTPGTDAEGVGTMNWGTAQQTEIPIRLQLLWLAKDQMQYGEKNISKGLAYLDGEIVITDQNTAITITEGQHLGRKFRVTGVYGAGGHHWEIFIEETDGNFV